MKVNMWKDTTRPLTTYLSKFFAYSCRFLHPKKHFRNLFCNNNKIRLQKLICPQFQKLEFLDNEPGFLFNMQNLAAACRQTFVLGFIP